MFIESHPEYAAAKWARYLDVSLSGYYSWKDRKEQRQKEVDEYKKMIKTIFQESNGTYGVDRICGELRKRGKIASYHRVKRFMDDMGLHSIHKRRRQKTLTDSRRARGDEYVNLVKDLEITEPFQVVSSDISYIRTMKGFEYLCTVKDIASGIVLAESMAEHMNSDLVLATIKKALNRWHLPAGTIFHSDRGSQYTSQKVMEYLSDNHIYKRYNKSDPKMRETPGKK